MWLRLHLRVDLRASLQQQPHGVGVLVPRGEVQRGEALLVPGDGREVGAVAEQRGHQPGPAEAGGQVQRAEAGLVPHREAAAPPAQLLQHGQVTLHTPLHGPHLTQLLTSSTARQTAGRGPPPRAKLVSGSRPRSESSSLASVAASPARTARSRAAWPTHRCWGAAASAISSSRVRVLSTEVTQPAVVLLRC